MPSMLHKNNEMKKLKYDVRLRRKKSVKEMSLEVFKKTELRIKQLVN
jgi:hypothetical protein